MTGYQGSCLMVLMLYYAVPMIYTVYDVCIQYTDCYENKKCLKLISYILGIDWDLNFAVIVAYSTYLLRF